MGGHAHLLTISGCNCQIADTIGTRKIRAQLQLPTAGAHTDHPATQSPSPQPTQTTSQPPASHLITWSPPNQPPAPQRKTSIVTLPSGLGRSGVSTADILAQATGRAGVFTRAIWPRSKPRSPSQPPFVFTTRLRGRPLGTQTL